MNQNFQNRYRMMRSTLAALSEIRQVWSGNTMIAQECARLQDNTAAIETCNARALGATGKEQRKGRIELRNAAVDAVLPLANVTRTYAEEMPAETVLRIRVTVSRTGLRATPEVDLHPKLQELFETCMNARPNIPGNPLNDEDYRNAGACIHAYGLVIDDARQSNVNRQAEYELLDALFKKGSYILGRIDRLMASYGKSHPLEYAKYRAARSIIDYGAGRKPKEKKSATKNRKPKTDEPQAPAFAAEDLNTADTPPENPDPEGNPKPERGTSDDGPE